MPKGPWVLHLKLEPKLRRRLCAELQKTLDDDRVIATTTQRLAITGLIKSFEGVRAFSRADPRVNAGEIHGFLGKNGSVRANCVQLVTSIHRVTRGSVCTCKRVRVSR